MPGAITGPRGMLSEEARHTLIPESFEPLEPRQQLEEARLFGLDKGFQLFYRFHHHHLALNGLMTMIDNRAYNATNQG